MLGATGHIGAHIVRALLAEGHPVRAAYRNPQYLSVLDGLPVERVRVDVADAQSLRGALEGCEWVFHAAGYYPRFGANRSQAVREGLDAIQRTLDVLQRAHPARVVFTSSAATIQRLANRPATEADAEPWPLPCWRPLYATVKIAMEHAVLTAARAGLPAVIVNPSICLGEYDAHRFSGQLILAYAKHRLPFYVDHQMAVVYTGDVGTGHLRAAERGCVGQRYLLTTQHVTLRELAGMVACVAGVPEPRWRLPYPRSWGAGQWLDGSKAVRELDLSQTPIEEAIRRALAWFREHGYV